MSNVAELLKSGRILVLIAVLALLVAACTGGATQSPESPP